MSAHARTPAHKRAMSGGSYNASENTVREMTPFTIENYAEISVEYLYHFIRFNTFPDVTDEHKKAFFMEAKNVQLRKPDTFSQIVNAINTTNFGELQRVVSNANKVNVTDVISEAVGKPVEILDTWSIIVDAYFKESDSSLAIDLFRTLLFFPILEGKLDALKMFIDRYLSTTDNESREMMVSGPVWNAVML
jgi:hypothetical protein